MRIWKVWSNRFPISRVFSRPPATALFLVNFKRFRECVNVHINISRILTLLSKCLSDPDPMVHDFFPPLDFLRSTRSSENPKRTWNAKLITPMCASFKEALTLLCQKSSACANKLRSFFSSFFWGFYYHGWKKTWNIFTYHPMRPFRLLHKSIGLTVVSYRIESVS